MSGAGMNWLQRQWYYNRPRFCSRRWCVRRRGEWGRWCSKHRREYMLQELGRLS